MVWSSSSDKDLTVVFSEFCFGAPQSSHYPLEGVRHVGEVRDASANDENLAIWARIVSLVASSNPGGGARGALALPIFGATKTSAFSTNAQSRFASVVLDSVLRHRVQKNLRNITPET